MSLTLRPISNISHRPTRLPTFLFLPSSPIHLLLSPDLSPSLSSSLSSIKLSRYLIVSPYRHISSSSASPAHTLPLSRHSSSPTPDNKPQTMTAFTSITAHAQQQQTVNSLYVIYDADGTPTGELVYILKKLLGIAHCAACDITHGPRREKPEFTTLKTTAWGVPVHNIHRDEMDPSMAAAVGSVLPCVVARSEKRDVILLGPAELDQCAGDVFSFEKAVNNAVGSLGLFVPSPIPVCRLPAAYEQTQHTPIRRKFQQLDDGDNSDICDDAVVPS